MWQVSPATPNRRHRVRTALIAVAALVIVGGVGAYVINAVLIVPNADRPATISKLPEANLLMPGSHVFDRSSAKPGYDGARVTTAAGVDASKTQVFDYVRTQLSSRGWQGPESTDLNAPEHWSKGHYVFSITFLGNLGDRTYPGESQYSTTYEIDVYYAS